MIGTFYARHINKNIFDQSKTDLAEFEKQKIKLVWPYMTPFHHQTTL